MRNMTICSAPSGPRCEAGVDLDFFRKILWELFKGPLLILAAPALPLLLFCPGILAAMIFRELRKNK